MTHLHLVSMWTFFLFEIVCFSIVAAQPGLHVGEKFPEIFFDVTSQLKAIKSNTLSKEDFVDKMLNQTNRANEAGRMALFYSAGLKRSI